MFRKDQESKNKLLCVIGKMDITGRLKLMKLMFFLEHLNIGENKLSPDKLFAGNEFIIYKFGPFSFDVVNDLEKLKKEKLIEESSPDDTHIIPQLTEYGEYNIKTIISKEVSDEDVNRIEKIKELFDDLSGEELEVKSLEYLGISKEDKERYMGVPISVFLSEKS